MYFNILKKDLKRKKAMNIILFVFVVLCTTFMASSVNNMYTTSNALDHYAEVSNLSDYFLLTSKESNADDWVDSSSLIQAYEKNDYINVSVDNVRVAGETFTTNGSINFMELPKNYNVALDENDTRITSIENGEIALSYSDATQNHIEIGDTITVKYGDNEKAFTVKYIVKDMALGTSYMGMSRLMISSEDYETLSKSDDVTFYRGYSVITDDVIALEKDLSKQTFTVYFRFDNDMVIACYTMEMMIAQILIVVSLMLIFIAFIILHFTIGFTIQEDYKQIGIMKAIGLKNGGIKQLYITKYSFLAVLGAVVGVILSIPFGNLLIDYIKKTIALEDSSGNFILNIMCAVFVVLLVIVFCYLSTGKINKFTAIQAIRSGSAGERYKAKSIYKINRHTKAFLPFQMALNDILSGIKSYLVLIVTFILGTLLVILPLNMANTLKSDSVIALFGLTQSDVYIDNNNFDSYLGKDINFVLNEMEALEELYHESGVDISLAVEYSFMPSFYTDDQDESLTIYSNQAYGFDATNYSYTDGSAPVLSNELAMSERCMEKLGVEVGDSVNVVIGDTTKSYIITASYQSANNLGEGVRFSSSAETDFKFTIDILSFVGDFENRNNIEEQREKIKEITPDFKIETAHEYIETLSGSITETIDSLVSMILLLVIIINCLITVLFVRMFISKDSGEIALLKSIGFGSKSIQLWQAFRILIVLIVSIITAVLLSNLLNPLMVSYTFGSLGASKAEPVINPLDVFLKYPLILFAGTGISALFSVISVKSITFKQLGNVE